MKEWNKCERCQCLWNAPCLLLAASKSWWHTTNPTMQQGLPVEISQCWHTRHCNCTYKFVASNNRYDLIKRMLCLIVINWPIPTNHLNISCPVFCEWCLWCLLDWLIDWLISNYHDCIVRCMNSWVPFYSCKLHCYFGKYLLAMEVLARFLMMGFSHAGRMWHINVPQKPSLQGEWSVDVKGASQRCEKGWRKVWDLSRWW